MKASKAGASICVEKLGLDTAHEGVFKVYAVLLRDEVLCDDLIVVLKSVVSQANKSGADCSAMICCRDVVVGVGRLTFGVI